MNVNVRLYFPGARTENTLHFMCHLGQMVVTTWSFVMGGRLWPRQDSAENRAVID
jgi:hypothetical protein